jgi:hypothetical protein
MAGRANLFQNQRLSTIWVRRAALSRLPTYAFFNTGFAEIACAPYYNIVCKTNNM